MKRKQSCGIFMAEMIKIDIDRMDEAARRTAFWFAKVGTMTALLALIGVLAGPDLPKGVSRVDAELPRWAAGL